MAKSTPRSESAAVKLAHHPWQSAAAFAARAHRNQLRKDGRTPYYSHVVRVAFTVTQVFKCDDPIAIAAALLHDTIEDTTTDYEDLNKRFGKEVADTVAALTKNMALPEAEREKVYDAGLAKASWQARLVKLADAYDNLHDVETFTPERRAEQRKKAIERCKRAVSIALAGGMGSKDPSRKVIEDAAEIVRRIYAR